MVFRRLFSTLGKARAPAGKPGARLYAVGDIHGRLDLLDPVLARIEAEVAEAPGVPTHVVFVGDLIDRGPDSRGVVDRLAGWAPAGIRPVFLLGNHEEMLLDVLAGRKGLVHDWLEYGGAECLRSYGIDPIEIAGLDARAAAALVERHVPRAHVAFLQGFADSFRFGDYLFVHAGIRPGVPIEAQTERDLRWIRDDFLADTRDHGVVVVHGHTISDGVDERPNRIGIDTGAYRTDVLTALVVEGRQRRILATGAGGDVAAGAPLSYTGGM